MNICIFNIFLFLTFIITVMCNLHNPKTIIGGSNLGNFYNNGISLLG